MNVNDLTKDHGESQLMSEPVKLEGDDCNSLIAGQG